MKQHPYLAYSAWLGGMLLALAQPAGAVKIEERTCTLPNHTRPEKKYLILRNDNYTSPVVKQFDVLVCLHGAGDTATVFAKTWTRLVDSRLNLIVVVPEADIAVKTGYIWSGNPTPYITAIIDDLTAHDRINPKHVMLMGTSQGGTFAFYALSSRPDLFACFGGLATECPASFFTPKLKTYADKIAIYYAVGTLDEAFADAYGPTVARLKTFGFTFITEQPKCGHYITYEEIDHMMVFFDRALQYKDTGKPLPATPTKK